MRYRKRRRGHKAAFPDREIIAKAQGRFAKSEADYPANIFLQMLYDRGGLATAKYLINSPKPSDGYTALYERGRLDLTVEAVVIENPKWHKLFTPEELTRARRRLKDYRYMPKENFH